MEYVGLSKCWPAEETLFFKELVVDERLEVQIVYDQS